MSTPNGDFGFKLATMKGDTFVDASTDDVILCAYDGPPTRAFLTGYSLSTSSANINQSVSRISSNALTMKGGVYASNIRLGTVSGSDTLDVAGDVTFRSNVMLKGFSNVASNTYITSLSVSSLTHTSCNLAIASVNLFTVGSNLVVNGVLQTANMVVNANEIVMCDLIVSGYCSNGGSFVGVGASNVNGASFCTNTSNTCNVFVGGILTLAGAFACPSLYTNGGTTYTSNVIANQISTQGFSNSCLVGVGGTLWVCGGLIGSGFCNVRGDTYSASLVATCTTTQTLCNTGNAYFVGALNAAGGLDGAGFSNHFASSFMSNLNAINITNSNLSNTGSTYIAKDIGVGGMMTGGNFINNINGSTTTSNINAFSVVTQTYSNVGNAYIGGTLYSTTSIFGNMFSNVVGNTYASSLTGVNTFVTQTLSNTAGFSVSGRTSALGGIVGSWFSNISGTTYGVNVSCLNHLGPTLSNLGDAYVKGCVVLGSNLTVNGTLVVNNFENISSNLTINASQLITSNLNVSRDIYITGDLLMVGTSNTNRSLYTATHSNIGNLSLGGAMSLGGGLTQLQSNVIDSSTNGQFSNLTSSTITTGALSAGNTNYFRNRIINGDMRVDQRCSGTSRTAINGMNTYGPDRFYTAIVGSGTVSIQQIPITPLTAGYASLSSIGGAAFTNCVQISVTTVNTSPVAGDVMLICQRVEALSLSDLAWGTSNASPIIMSFYCLSTVTGTFTSALRGNAQSVLGTFTISVANVWQRVQLKFPGNTSSGWPLGNTYGLSCVITLLSSYPISYSGTWQSGTYNGITGTNNFLAGMNTFYLTGVQLEKGTILTPFEFRPYALELQLCQRYFYQMTSTVSNQQMLTCYGNTGVSTGGGGTFTSLVAFPTTMCRVPDLALTNMTASSNFLANGNGIGMTSVGAYGSLYFTDNTTSSASVSAFYNGNNLPSSLFGVFTAQSPGMYISWSAEI